MDPASLGKIARGPSPRTVLSDVIMDVMLAARSVSPNQTDDETTTSLCAGPARIGIPTPISLLRPRIKAELRESIVEWKEARERAAHGYHRMPLAQVEVMLEARSHRAQKTSHARGSSH